MLRSLTGLFKERCSSYSAVFPERLDGDEAGLQLMHRLESCDVFAVDLSRGKLQSLRIALPKRNLSEVLRSSASLLLTITLCVYI